MEIIYTLSELKEALIADIASNHSIDMEDVELFIIPDAGLNDDEAIRIVCDLAIRIVCDL